MLLFQIFIVNFFKITIINSVSEQFQSSFRAISEQFQSSFA